MIRDQIGREESWGIVSGRLFNFRIDLLQHFSPKSGLGSGGQSPARPAPSIAVTKTIHQMDQELAYRCSHFVPLGSPIENAPGGVKTRSFPIDEPLSSPRLRPFASPGKPGRC